MNDTEKMWLEENKNLCSRCEWNYYDNPCIRYGRLGKRGSCPRSWQGKKYGKLTKATWREDLNAGFKECWRVLKPCGTLIFKWNETQISVRQVLACIPQRPIFGHTTTANLKTHWMTFFKNATEARHD